MDNYQEDIDYILDNFDFEKVKKVMDTLKWKYWNSEGDTISIYELRRMARNLLKEAYNAADSDHWFGGSGGFEVERWMYLGDTKKYLCLKFVVTEWNNAD